MNTQTQVGQIYSCLQDDLSREIFENRLLYSFTKELKFIRNIINISFPLEEYKSKLKPILENTNIIVYGAGFAGACFVQLLKLLIDVTKIVAVCDSAKEKQGTDFVGYKVIAPEELKEYENIKVLIAVFEDSTAKEILLTLTDLGFKKDQIIQNTVIDIVARLKNAYFEPDIIQPLSANNEIFIDGGCYNFYNSKVFLEKFGGENSKIIAFEPNPNQYPICLDKAKGVNNAIIHPYALFNQNTELSFDNTDIDQGSARISDESNSAIKVKAVKLDDILNGEKATIIKMDIEGAELNALKGAKQTILKYRPKLAICVYHKPEDIWEIPAYILSLNPDYKLYLRHYSFGHGETVLYAV